MTNKAEILERSVIRSSVMPSAKCSCRASLDMLANGKTAIEGLSGRGKAMLAVRCHFSRGGCCADARFQCHPAGHQDDRAGGCEPPQSHGR